MHPVGRGGEGGEWCCGIDRDVEGKGREGRAVGDSCKGEPCGPKKKGKKRGRGRINVADCPSFMVWGRGKKGANSKEQQPFFLEILTR